MKKIAILVMMLGATSANAVNLNVDGKNCTLDSLVVEANGNVTAKCVNSGAVTVTPPVPVTPVTPVPVTPVPIVPVTIGDPGMYMGTWRSQKFPNVTVVDQSGTKGAGGVTGLPGCVNQVNNTVGCPATSPTGINLTQGQTLSIRYLPSSVGSGKTYFRLTSGNGSGIGVQTSISLSSVPGDFGVSEVCKKQNNVTGTYPTIVVGPDNCSLTPGVIQYFNVKVEGSCGTPYACTFKLMEPIEAQN